MKIAAVVILYNPSSEVVKNIQSYANAIDQLFIVDNSAKPVKLIQDSFIDKPNFVYLHDRENKGIALRLNQVIQLAKDNMTGF